jgi:hypothetical protein
MNNNSTHNPTYALNSNRSSGDSSYRDNANVNFKIINTDGEDMESDAINN